MAVKSPTSDPRRRQDRIAKRLERLQLLVPPSSARRPELAVKARNALLSAHNTDGLRPRHIPIRPAFVRLGAPLAGEATERTLSQLPGTSRAEKPIPPMAKLFSPRGLGLQLALIALFTASCVKPRRDGQVDLPFPLETSSPDQLGWMDLTVAHATGDTNVEFAVGPKGNRLRQIKAGLDLLAHPAVGLLELPHAGSRTGKYDDLRLMHEAGARPEGDPIPYRIPDPMSERVLRIPVDFWLQGWVHLMTDSEIGAWLMFRDAMSAPDLYPPRAADGGFYVTGDFRIRHYCLTKETWNAYRMLERFGLLRVERAEGRRADGTYEDFSPTHDRDKPPAHRFWVTDEGLGQVAAHAVPAAVAAALEGD